MPPTHVDFPESPWVCSSLVLTGLLWESWAISGVAFSATTSSGQSRPEQTGLKACAEIPQILGPGLDVSR